MSWGYFILWLILFAPLQGCSGSSDSDKEPAIEEDANPPRGTDGLGNSGDRIKAAIKGVFIPDGLILKQPEPLYLWIYDLTKAEVTTCPVLSKSEFFCPLDSIDFNSDLAFYVVDKSSEIVASIDFSRSDKAQHSVVNMGDNFIYDLGTHHYSRDKGSRKLHFVEEISVSFNDRVRLVKNQDLARPGFWPLPSGIDDLGAITRIIVTDANIALYGFHLRELYPLTHKRALKEFRSVHFRALMNDPGTIKSIKIEATDPRILSAPLRGETLDSLLVWRDQGYFLENRGTHFDATILYDGEISSNQSVLWNVSLRDRNLKVATLMRDQIISPMMITGIGYDSDPVEIDFEDISIRNGLSRPFEVPKSDTINLLLEPPSTREDSLNFISRDYIVLTMKYYDSENTPIDVKASLFPKDWQKKRSYNAIEEGQATWSPDSATLTITILEDFEELIAKIPKGIFELEKSKTVAMHLGFYGKKAVSKVVYWFRK